VAPRLESRPAIHYAPPMLHPCDSGAALARRSVLVLACFSNLILAPRVGAAVSGAPGGRPWRMTSAPAADGPTLLAFLAPPSGRPLPEGGEGDTTRTSEPKTTTQQTPTTNQAPFDTTHSAARKSFPGGDSTALETLGPGSAIHTFPTGGAAAPNAAGAHGRQGFLGLTPIAILAGLIALHVFIVSTVGK